MKIVAAVIVVWAGVAHADATVDWARGLVIAEGVGVADRHAPNPAVARGTSRRGAEDAAKKLIAGKLHELPLAAGGTVGKKLDDKAVKALLDHAISLDAEPETDGAWRVTMGLPIEAVRQALDGGRTLPAKGDAGPAVIVLDGGPVKPAIGWKIGTLEAPIVWVPELPAWAKSAPHVKIDQSRSGRIEAPGIDATGSTLFVIVQPP